MSSNTYSPAWPMRWTEDLETACEYCDDKSADHLSQDHVGYQPDKDFNDDCFTESAMDFYRD